jgi:hypothetical protein
VPSFLAPPFFVRGVRGGRLVATRAEPWVETVSLTKERALESFQAWSWAMSAVGSGNRPDGVDIRSWSIGRLNNS